ncbi:hypothetical protein VF21_06084 [Pseudogymnoascus sp. 05NY08]|nr:hypothetical protein VF21_06084 [Pseudogymnoascus sp. 05NY08]
MADIYTHSKLDQSKTTLSTLHTALQNVAAKRPLERLPPFRPKPPSIDIQPWNRLHAFTRTYTESTTPLKNTDSSRIYEADDDVRSTTNISSPSVQCQHPQSESKSPVTQLTATDRVSPTILQHTQRQETRVAGPSSEPAVAPFLLPSLREPSIYANSTDKSIAGLPVAHVFEHPALLKSGEKTGDPIKRDLIPRHRPTNPSAASPTTPLSLAVPAPAPPLVLPVLDNPEVTYQDILDGLQLGLSAIMDSDVDFWVKDVVGTSVRRFLADIAALGELRG